MFHVELPKLNTSEYDTLASFYTEDEAITWAMENLGADEHGNINVISDDGCNEEE